MSRVKRLLGSGYFPSQLPPNFTTKDLAARHSFFYSAWKALQPHSSTSDVFGKAPNSKPELFSVARVGHRRRTTSLVNPVAQTFISTHLVNHWGEFLALYRKSRINASRPRFLSGGSRATSILPMQKLYDRVISKSAGYRFMLRTDLSRFFPTIYTHSIPWAFHSKTVAKKNKKPTLKYFANLLDQDLRQGQDGQTIGIPIGPDTSQLIAEAIATSVDLEFRKRLKVWPAGFRYVDDYYLFFKSAKEAEEALAALVRSLKEFELQINFDKTFTCPVIEIQDDSWTHRLRNFEIASKVRRQASDINDFFEMAKSLARKNSDESVMLYALKRASATIIRKECWDSFEAHICHVALAYPNTLQTIARVLSTYSRIGYPINQTRLSRLANAVIEDHAPLGHHSEVTWGLWIIKELGLSLSESNIDLVSAMHSSVCALLLLDLHHSGCLAKFPKFANWKTLQTKEALHDELWLLSYEAGVRGWGGFTDAHITADPYFDILLKEDVHFYDDAASMPPLFYVKTDAMKAHEVENENEFFDLEIDDFDDFIEFEDGDGGYEGIVFPFGNIVDTNNDEEDEPEVEDLPF